MEAVIFNIFVELLMIKMKANSFQAVFLLIIKPVDQTVALFSQFSV